MIHIITAENRHLFRHALMEMHRQRKALFVDEMKWSLDAPEGLEIDAYDAPDTTYLIEADAPRAPVRASVRLLSTERAHLLSEVFPRLCANGAPRGANIWEASRFCPAPNAPREERRQLLALMIAGIMETGLLFGVDQVTFVASAALKPLALAAGWRVEALGPTLCHRRDRITAFAAEIDAAGLKRVRVKHGFDAPLTRFMPGEMRQAA